MGENAEAQNCDNDSEKNELDDRMTLRLLGSTELLTSVYSAAFDYREELYADEEVLCELAIYPPMCNTVPDAPSALSNRRTGEATQWRRRYRQICWQA